MADPETPEIELRHVPSKDESKPGEGYPNQFYPGEGYYSPSPGDWAKRGNSWPRNAGPRVSRDPDGTEKTSGHKGARTRGPSGPETVYSELFLLGVQAFKSPRMENDAHTDPSTGTNNRAWFEKVKSGDIELKNRSTHLAFLDVNNLKPVNDLLGHEAGDWLIKTMGSALKKYAASKGTDAVARVGGDEFVVILADPKAENESFHNELNDFVKVEIKEFIAKLRDPKHGLDQTAVDDIAERFKQIPAAAVGVAEVDPSGTNRLLSATKRADLAMYEKKTAQKAQNIVEIKNSVFSLLPIPIRKNVADGLSSFATQLYPTNEAASTTRQQQGRS